ncbi:PH, RCC1 and FYVE domains-containing protein 1 [Cajanus cajan]|uniref:PH, RCC1 and FYVE domains-containing protein 1 n=1 Tax=Cajanus cajan TaxID=3821 RepID=UPI0010FAF73C|nr:PH, RCC1 and FYVE domains-containing protein 1 [Cajanus cajan]
MQSKTNVGDGFRVSVSSTPSNSSGGSEKDEIYSFRDVYIWGEVFTNGVSLDGIGTQIPSKENVLIPKPLESNVVLDVSHIATGVQHIAMVTRQGQVFTWGKESGGRLGHGIDKDFNNPRLVEFLKDTNFEFVTCGEYHTCAISKSYELYTWGDGTHNIGLLGHGYEVSHWIPKMVNGPLEGLQVVSVACGSWHSALTTSNGKLFTFGDGAFGVLGHGDRESVLYPREVQLLNGLKAMKVACGVWHTAAIIEVAFQSSSNTSPWKLFTWGDGDKYRLGHGNKETYLQPTRVSSLMEYNFHKVACGNTMTVALTTSGHVFTMGGTENGQLGNPLSIGKMPTLVQDKLLGEFVDELSCGAHHVAILTTKGELYTWGMGANGRLGHGDVEDRKSPTLVVALKDRQIKNISCGFNFTSCICIHKWVSTTDKSDCSSCRQAFGLKRKGHNCHNCGLVFCHACSSKKALKTAMSLTPEKPHRVCDNCYVKLKIVNDNGASQLDKNATHSHYSINRKEISNQETIRSTGTLLSIITEPVKYLEIKNTILESKSYTTSFVRASQVPSLVQLKDIIFPSSLSSTYSVLRPTIPPNPLQTSPPPTTLVPISTHTRSQSPIRASIPRFSGSLSDSLKRTNELLSQEVSKLQKQIQSLKKRNDMQDMEIKKLNKKSTEAIALAAVESSNHRVTKDFVESTVYQLKEMIEKFPQETTESKNFKSVLTQVEDFLKENLECKASSSPPKLGSMKQNAPDISAPSSDFSKLQIDRLEENVDVTKVDPCLNKGNFLNESEKSMLDPKQQNVCDLPTLNSGFSKLQKYKLEEQTDGIGGNQCQDEGNFVEENNKSELESKQQNKPSSNVSTSEMQEHKLEEYAIEVDPYQDKWNLLEESNTPNMLALISDVSELLKDRLEENVEVTRVDQSQVEGYVLQESNGSRSLEFSSGIMPPQNLHNCSRSLDSSRFERQGEIQVIEKFEHGVYVTLVLRSDGIKIFKQVKFNKRWFTKSQAEEWWNQNKGRVLRKYCPTHQKLSIGTSNVTSLVKEIIETYPP